MQPLTEQQTQRVWSRVMNAQAVPAAQMNEQTGSGRRRSRFSDARKASRADPG
ncbi:MAG: hypothetical protein ACLU3I_06035 [Acutalibacteraceae bacterium]